ncbi:ion channel [Ruegeria atlantica]
MLASGTIFYSQVEGWTLIDSLYFSATTISTVG